MTMAGRDSAAATDPEPDLDRDLAELRALPKGTLLDGRFEVERRLGAGGMAVVYLVFDRRLEVHRALKIMSIVGQNSPEWRDRFLREARKTLDVQHANVVRAFDL